MIRTPLNLEILLHIHTKSTPIPYSNTPAVKVGIAMLWERGMIVEDPVEADGAGSGYKTTARAHAYIDHILKAPFPVETWVMPSVSSEADKEIVE